MKRIFIWSLLLVMFKSYAGMWVEPYLGFYTASELSGSTPRKLKDNGSWSLSGTSFGTRFGFDIFGYLIGLDGMLTEKLRLGPYTTANREYALVAGYRPNEWMRVWVGRVFSSTLKNETGDEVLIFDDVSGFKFGFSTNVSKNLALNIEYSNLDYGSATFEKEAKNISKERGIDGDINNVSKVLLSVSIPLNL